MKLKGANYDESMIKLRLREKEYPENIISEMSNDFLLLTNGIPLFVDMIPKWVFRIEEHDRGKLKKLEDKKEEFKRKLKEDIGIFLSEKMTKFKNEYYDKFSDEEKLNFKKVLLALEDESSSLKISDYAKYVDYQLMDFSTFIKNKNKMMSVRTDYPDLVRLYKEKLDIEIDPKHEMKIYINKMKSFIHNNKSESKENFNSLAGNEFEKVVMFNFVYNNTFRKDLNKQEVLSRAKKFDLYNYVFFEESFEANVFSRIELNTGHFPLVEELPANHILRTEGDSRKIISSDFTSQCYFQNENRSIPVIDGGFVINPCAGKYEIITYDATVGKKDWFYENMKLEPEIFETYKKKYPLLKESKLTENLIKVIAKLETTLPRTFEMLKINSFFEYEFKKHLIIVPRLKGKLSSI